MFPDLNQLLYEFYTEVKEYIIKLLSEDTAER